MMVSRIEITAYSVSLSYKPALSLYCYICSETESRPRFGCFLMGFILKIKKHFFIRRKGGNADVCIQVDHCY